MSALLDYMRLCRLCLVKDKVNVPIFGNASDVRQIFLKISACLPVKVSQDDNLPKSICDSCLYKIDLLYQFWNTTVNAEKQLIQWLTEIGVDVNIKNTNPPSLQVRPQSHAHPHSMPETIILKEERQDPEIKVMEQSGQNYQVKTQQNMYSDYELPYQPQINMTVGAPTDFSQPTEALADEDTKVANRRSTQSSPAKRRGRPPKQLTPPSSAATITPAATTSTATSTVTNSKRRSSAAAAAAAVAAAAANASSDESDIDDRLGEDDSDDEDMDVTIAKEEADSEDEEYMDNPDALEPTTFVGVASGTDSEQPGPSGLSATSKTSSLPANNTANESGKSADQWLQGLRKIAPKLITNALVVINEHDYILQNFKCKQCDEVFINLETLEKHKEDVHIKGVLKNTKTADTSMCEMCGKILLTISLRDHILRHLGERPFICDSCGKSFVTKRHLMLHYRQHTGEKPYCCPFCDKRFARDTTLRIHKRRHTGETPYSCHLCEKKFVCRTALVAHCTTNHQIVRQSKSTKPLPSVKTPSDRKRYPCQICGKLFYNYHYLKVHARIHTNEKPYECTQCGKSFAQASSLNIHKKYHEGARPFACEVCKKTYIMKSDLTRHSQSHDPDFTTKFPFPCDECDCKYKSRKTLNHHKQQKHNADNENRPVQMFTCDVCGKHLSRASNLRNHRTKHFKNNTYTCITCDKSFTNKDDVPNHECDSPKD